MNEMLRRASLIALFLPLLSHAGLAEGAAPGFALAEIDYVDTSGEVRDQRAEHQQRLTAFAEALRGGLAASGRFRIATLDCAPDPCPAASIDPAKLVAEARRAGAAYLLLGGVHKESTLVQWAKFQIVDVATEKVAFDRLLTFRGDDDAAWRHAAKFLVGSILAPGAMP